MIIDPDATSLEQDDAKPRWPYANYVCGCTRYVGDIDAPHETPCPEHAHDDNP